VRKQMLPIACFILGLIPALCQAGPLADKVFGYCGWQSLSGTVSIQYAFDGATKTPQVGEFYITDDGYVGMRAKDDSWHEIIHEGKISEKLVGASPAKGTEVNFGPLACLSKVACITNGSKADFEVEGEAGQTLTITAQDMDMAALVIRVKEDGSMAEVRVQGFDGASMDQMSYGEAQGTRYLADWRVNRIFTRDGETHHLSVGTTLTGVTVDPDVQSGAWGEP